MGQLFKTLLLVLREALSPVLLTRCPEPTAVMDDPHSVASFHEQGAAALLPIYHFNALAISRLAPANGLILDLGSGSGQFLAYLARHRPDLKIIGLDLSGAMVDRGGRMLSNTGLSNHVDLRVGDMTDFYHRAPEQVDVITSVFSMHHLPASSDLRRCVGEMASLRKRCDCGIWIFDHARPRHPRTADKFPEVFSPAADPAFQQDSRNSLIASYSFEEMTQALDDGDMGTVHHQLSSILRLYQTHWIEGGSRGRDRAQQGLWRRDNALPAGARRQYEGLRRILRGVPLDTTAEYSSLSYC